MIYSYVEVNWEYLNKRPYYITFSSLIDTNWKWKVLLLRDLYSQFILIRINSFFAYLPWQRKNAKLSVQNQPQSTRTFQLMIIKPTNGKRNGRAKQKNYVENCWIIRWMRERQREKRNYFGSMRSRVTVNAVNNCMLLPYIGGCIHLHANFRCASGNCHCFDSSLSISCCVSNVKVAIPTRNIRECFHFRSVGKPKIHEWNKRTNWPIYGIIRLIPFNFLFYLHEE